MVVKKKFKIASFAAILVLSLVIVLNVVFTLAIFLDVDELKENLKFGSIRISVNNNGWFSATQNYYASIKPNDIILNEDIKFNLQQDGQPVYIRVKYDVNTISTNSEILKVSNYLKYRELNLSTSSDYKWSEKIGNYYYLLDATGNPLAVEEVRSEDFIFLSSSNSKISNDLEFDSTKVNDDNISILIGVEAIQTANLDNASEKPLLEDIETELNTIYNVVTEGEYSVTFDVNGNQYTVNNIAYGGSGDLPVAVQEVMNSANFDGFSLWNEGVGVIKATTNNHTYISNNKLNNITENITLYAKNTNQKYLVEFYNDSTLIQSYKVKAGDNAEYLGVTPTKSGYIFVGWDKSLENISADTIFYAQFEKIN